MADRVLFALVAEFDDVDSVTKAARAVRDAGYTRFDVYSPFPIHGIERAMGLKPTRLPWIVLASGLTGLSLALFFQWWTNGFDYPFKISGKPLFGIPANIPITFEFTVLLSAFAAFFGMFLLNRLPEHHHALFEHPRFARATDDGFFLAIERTDPRFERESTLQLLRSLAPVSIEACDESDESSAAPHWLRASLVAIAALALVPLAIIAARRGSTSAEQPFHLIGDMDSQTKYRAQSANAFFADGRAMRPDAEGTVAVGELRDELVATGRTSASVADASNYAQTIPIRVDAALLARGRQRFGIYCAPCHGQAGYGDGLVAQRAKDLQEQTWVPPASLHEPLVRSRPVGQIFETIRNGVRTMPAYGRQMKIEDSWAIVAYVRALQRSQNASLSDVPNEERAALGVQ